MTKFKNISRIQREKENKTMRDLAGGGLFNLKSIIVIHPKKKKKKKKLKSIIVSIIRVLF
jgi:hypothetical protein